MIMIMKKKEHLCFLLNLPCRGTHLNFLKFLLLQLFSSGFCYMIIYYGKVIYRRRCSCLYTELMTKLQEMRQQNVLNV